MVLEYWYSRCPDDSDCYSVRERTKKEAKAQIARQNNAEDWPAPRKVSVVYASGFHLMKECAGENRFWWECD